MKSPPPPWLKISLRTSPAIDRLKGLTREMGLATVCEQARCPNLHECWSEGTATLMIAGDTCTRGCGFCHVKTARNPAPLDAQEPAKVARTVAECGWRYIVITSVDRDDLPDGGARHWGDCIMAIHGKSQATRVEALIPDFTGDALRTVLDAGVDVLAHNLETVERLSPSVRDHRASYSKSLQVLTEVQSRQPGLWTKSSLMLGLGENDAELLTAFADLRTAGVDVLTLGQYLQASPRQLPVKRFVPPEEFARWKTVAERDFGFAYCAAGPLVRSSYKAAEAWLACQLKGPSQMFDVCVSPMTSPEVAA